MTFPFSEPRIFAEIELHGRTARLTEDGWVSDSPVLVELLDGLRGVVHPEERGYYPTQAHRLADRARLVFGAKVVQLAPPPNEEDRNY